MTTLHTITTKKSITTPAAIFSMFFGLSFLNFGILFLSQITPKLDTTTIVSSIFTAVGFIFTISTIINLFKKQKYTLTKEALILNGKRNKKYLWENFIHDIEVEKSVIRLKYITQKHQFDLLEIICSNNVYQNAAHISSHIMRLQIGDRIHSQKTLINSLKSQTSIQTVINSDKLYPSIRTIPSLFVGIPWILFSSLFIWISVSMLFFGQGTTTSSGPLVEIAIGIMGSLFFLVGWYMTIGGLKGTFAKGWVAAITPKFIILNTKQKIKILGWQDIKGVSKIKQKTQKQIMNIRASLTYFNKSYFPEEIYIRSDKDLHLAKRVILNNIKSKI